METAAGKVKSESRTESIEETAHEGRKSSLVVAALGAVLRGQPGRNPGNNDNTTRQLSGRSVGELAFGLAFMFSGSRMTTRERGAGKG